MKRLLAVAVLLSASPVLADTPPSIWERAKDPDAALAYDIHEQVQRRLESGRDEQTGAIDDRALLAVVPILERAHAETSKSALLRFDLAFAYYELKNFARAAEIYKLGVRDFADHPAVEDAWLRLALSCGHLGDSVCERTSYTKILQYETEEAVRAMPSLNLAETHMHLGNLREAIEGYRDVIRISGRFPQRETGPLAFWGLAVALDRSGDRIEAEKAARLAIDVGGKALLDDKTTTFFVPEYEIHWYHALLHIADARAARSARDAVVAWRRAETSYELYVKGAEGKNDRYFAVAKARLGQVQAERKRAEAAAASAREPARPAEPNERGDVPL